MPSNRLARLAVPVAVVLVVLMMVVPLPAAVLDILIAFNISISLLVLLVAMQVKKPLDFAVFPTIVLVATIFRLALNVSATRLVLRDGYAGHVIEAFGHIVIGGSLIIGLVVFAILVIIQLTVVTKGAERVAEVGARFTLDAMPGKQMAIDADLNAGLIDEDEARRRRKEVGAEADFYGAMDGGSKFVKGDAMAAIIITFVNLIGGFAVGMLQRGMSPGEAINTYSLLTVGDGLVSQIPALLMSVATGIIVTRSTSEGDVGNDLLAQFARQKEALRIAAGAVLGLALIPGLPKLPFIIVGGILLLASTRSRRRGGAAAGRRCRGSRGRGGCRGRAASRTRSPSRSASTPWSCCSRRTSSTSSTPPAAATCSTGCARCAARPPWTSGIVLPPVRTRDGATLPPGSYEIRVGGVSVATGDAPSGHLLAIGDDLDSLPGRHTQEPVFGLPAVWVPLEHRAAAEVLGATLVERAAVLTTHLAEMVRQHASRLLSLDDVRELLDVLKAERPAAVEELVPGLLPLSAVQRVLQGLLDEQVSIRDLGRVLEGVGQRARVTNDPDALLEAARASLGPALTAPYTRDGILHAITLEPGARDEGRGRAAGQRAGRGARARPVHRPAPGERHRDPRDGVRAARRDARAARVGATAAAVAAHAPQLHPPAAGDRVRRNGRVAADRDRRTGERRP